MNSNKSNNFFDSDSYSERFNNDRVAKFLMQLRNFNKINKIYKNNADKEGIAFIDSIVESLNISFEVDDVDLLRIPETGPFITVSNHPFGGIDGLLLMKIMGKKRSDFKVLANDLLHSIEPLRDYSLPLNDGSFDTGREFRFTAQAGALEHLKLGRPLGIFPASEISKVRSIKNIADKQWKPELLKFIKENEVPVVPVYFGGNNSWIFHLLGSLHPILQSARLPKEFLNKSRKTINIRIGQAIKPRQQAEFQGVDMYGRFLRAKTYALGTSMEVNKFFNPKFKYRLKKVQKIIDPIPKRIIKEEIDSIQGEYDLFESGNFKVFCAPSEIIPNILTEIGRLREITFREIGEGSNKSIDVDEYDLYFWQLIIWDAEKNQIAGAYRVGRGDEIYEKFGKKGFYFETLFKIQPEFQPLLKESLELGRSFLVKEYQRRPLSLFLLWKGILYFLLKNNQYRYLIGPASISNEFSKFSQGLIVDFFEKNYFDNEKAKYIEPRKEFRVKTDPNFDKEIFHKTTGGDVSKLDKFIQDIEPEYFTPVLLKKYIKLNGKLLGFNVDPKFNYCLDGLIILDIFDVPLNTLESLSKELNDSSILDRFNF
ncbi:MAG: lysophospholipid acyltransferase family protein [Bacteroidota bacterium]|nr:lysophospholipid acyltransferase family protein [Bacteroidota bacterium]